MFITFNMNTLQLKKLLFNKKVIHCPLLLGGILPQLKIRLFET